MNYLSNKYVLVLLFLLALPIACQKADPGELQKEYLENKINDYQAYKWRSCMKEILEKAEAKSDSFFVSMAKRQTFDSARVPNPIRRPGKPEPRIREDSIPLGPLLRKTGKDSTPPTTDSELQDTLN